jgi:ABC-type uncharacterized transport system ATPase subunit
MAEGELRVIIGPNGAGKTTFLDVITGKVQPTTGQARFKGKDLSKQAEHTIARLGIGRKFQTPRVYLNLTPRENLELSCNRDKNCLHHPVSKTPNRRKAHRWRSARNHWPRSQSRHSRRAALPWRKAVAGNWHVGGPVPRFAAGG